VGSFAIGDGGAPLELRYLEGVAGFDAQVGPDWQIPIAIQPSQGSLMVVVPEPDGTLTCVLGMATLAALSRLRRGSQSLQPGGSPTPGHRRGSDARC
jgi:hypothetical protein